MMETREINTLAIVTSLSSSDYLITDSGKRVQEQNIGKRVVSTNLGAGAKWIRIARFIGPSIGFVSASNGWNNLFPCPILLAFSFPSTQFNSPQYADVKVLFGSTTIFNKARILYKPNATVETECYLEIYQEAASEPVCYVEMLNYRNATALCELGSIPSSYVAKEFALTAGG